ncbi:MAG: DUF1844 domain-containing protein [Deltaproteobacteria bacterium]|nr:DUF1844 domain-containing protein [Deltaproteobacteria bacterium]
MSDYENEETQEFKVRDKRRFSPGGESSQSQESGKPDKPENSEEIGTQELRKKQQTTTRPPVDFSSLIASLAQTALFQLGVLRTPDMKEPIEPDLEGARQTIDVIAILELKTKGNLTEQEKKLIDDTLFQLRMAFIEMSK